MSNATLSQSIGATLPRDLIEAIARRVVELQEARRELPIRRWMDSFLADLDRSSITKAIDLSPVSRSTIYAYRQRCPEFRQRWKDVAERKAKKKKPARTNRRNPGELDLAEEKGEP